MRRDFTCYECGDSFDQTYGGLCAECDLDTCEKCGASEGHDDGCESQSRSEGGDRG